MSRSNYDKPFYVDFDKGIASIRCASNHDVLVQYDSMWPPKIFDLAKKTCDRMNKEVEISRPLRNCDVGTAEEQAERFKEFCEDSQVDEDYCSVCSKCVLKNESNCTLTWAQMPYEKAEEGETVFARRTKESEVK